MTIQAQYEKLPGTRYSVYRDIVQAVVSSGWQYTRVDLVINKEKFVEDPNVIASGLNSAIVFLGLKHMFNAKSRRGEAYIERLQ